MAPTPIPHELMEHLRFGASTLQTKIIWCFSPMQITYVCTSSTPNWYAHAKQSKNVLANLRRMHDDDGWRLSFSIMKIHF